jgi:uncharacterized protein
MGELMESINKAQMGLSLMKEAILEVLSENKEGLKCLEIARALNIRSDYEGKHKDYLPWALLGLLVNERKVDCINRVYKIRGKND